MDSEDLMVKALIEEEREACARICDRIAAKYSEMDPEWEDAARECAEAIRSRYRG